MGGTPVDPGDKNVNGKLSPELIQGVILASFGVFHACYKSGLVRDPNLQGVVQTRFVINPDGSVTSSTVSSGTTMADPKVVECIVAVYRTLKFPPPPKGTVTVVFPMKFGGPQD